MTFYMQKESSTGLSDFKFHVLSSSKSCLWVFPWTLGPFKGVGLSFFGGLVPLPNSRGAIPIVLCVNVSLSA